MSVSSPLSIPTAGEARAASPFLALFTDCETAAASKLSFAPVLTSLAADLVGRYNDSIKQVLAQTTNARSALLARKTRVLGSAKRLFHKQCKRTVADIEAADVTTEQLRVWASGASCPDSHVDFSFTAAPLLASRHRVQAAAIALRFNISIFFAVELGSVAAGDGLRVVSAAGPGLLWFEPHSRNEFSVMLAQADGSAPVWLTSGDVAVDVLEAVGATAVATAGSTAAAVRSDAVGQGTVSIVYGVLRKATPDAVLQLTVCGFIVADSGGDGGWSARVPRRPHAAHECAAEGSHVRTLAVVKGVMSGIAVSPDEKWMALGLNETEMIHVYALPGGELAQTFGGEGAGPLQFSSLYRLCFAPNGNLVVADYGNERLQEVTLEGVFVRFIGVGEFGDGNPACVAVHDDVIAVGCGGHRGGTSPRVVLFCFGSGAVMSRFGEVGTASGQLGLYCSGVRLTLDGEHVLLSEGGGKRLSLFTTAGVFVRRVGVNVLGGGMTDVSLSVSGEYVVTDSDSSRVCVFSPDGLELVRSWGRSGTDDGLLTHPIALATAGQHLYVLEFIHGKVLVFE